MRLPLPEKQKQELTRLAQEHSRLLRDLGLLELEYNRVKKRCIDEIQTVSGMSESIANEAGKELGLDLTKKWHLDSATMEFVNENE